MNAVYLKMFWCVVFKIGHWHRGIKLDGKF